MESKAGRIPWMKVLRGKNSWGELGNLKNEIIKGQTQSIPKRNEMGDLPNEATIVAPKALWWTEKRDV